MHEIDCRLSWFILHFFAQFIPIHIFNFPEIDDEVYYKFNEAKMLDWLAGRFSLIKDVMAKNEFVSGRLKNDGKNLNLHMANGNN